MLSQGLFKPSSQLFMAFSPRIWLWVRKEFENNLPFLSGALVQRRSTQCIPLGCWEQEMWMQTLTSEGLSRHEQDYCVQPSAAFFPSNLKKHFSLFFPQATSLSKDEFFFQHLSKFKHHNERAEKKTSLSRELLEWQQFQVAVCGNALLLQSWVPGSVGFLQLERQQLVHMCGEEIPGSQSLLLWGQTFFECCLMPVQMKSADCSVIW